MHQSIQRLFNTEELTVLIVILCPVLTFGYHEVKHSNVILLVAYLMRYISGKVQPQISGWESYKNRNVTHYFDDKAQETFLINA